MSNTIPASSNRGWRSLFRSAATPAPAPAPAQSDRIPPVPVPSELLQVFENGLQRGQQLREFAVTAVERNDLRLAAGVLQALVADTNFMHEHAAKQPSATYYLTHPEGRSDYERLLQVYGAWAETFTSPGRAVRDVATNYGSELQELIYTNPDMERALVLPPLEDVSQRSWESMDARSTQSWRDGTQALQRLEFMAVAETSDRVSAQIEHASAKSVPLHVSFPQPASTITSPATSMPTFSVANSGAQSRATEHGIGR